MWQWQNVVVPAVISGIFMVVVVIAQGRSARSTQREQSRTQEKLAAAEQDSQRDESAGEMALSLVREMRPRLTALENYHDAVSYWWTEEHLPRDRAMEREVARLDPKFALPAATPIPRLQRPAGVQT